MSCEANLYETHSHTPLCKHAVGQPWEYAEVAAERGLAGLVVTCHNPMPDRFSAGVRMGEDELPAYIDLVAEARRRVAGQIDVLLGLEADYFPGYEAWLENQLASAEFHYVLGSVHPHTTEFLQRYDNGDAQTLQVVYFRLLADSAETGLFDCLAHPDLIKNQTAADWDVDRILPEICRALDRIARTGVAMEINTSGRNKVIPEMNPCPIMLREMRFREIPVVIGADAHEPERVGADFLTALDLAEAAGYRCVSQFRERRRYEVPIATARRALCQKSAAGRA